jgi:transposase
LPYIVNTANAKLAKNLASCYLSCQKLSQGFHASERRARQIEQLETAGSKELEAGETEEVSQAAAKDRSFRSGKQTGQSASPCRTTCRATGSCMDRCTTGLHVSFSRRRMARLGEDVTELLDYTPGRFRVIRHVRPKYACRRCNAITKGRAPSKPPRTALVKSDGRRRRGKRGI